MKIFEAGAGPPVVIVPGVQGRWEWMRPGVEALARDCHVIAFSLADEPTCGAEFESARGFWCYVDQIARALDEIHVRKATICGVSYGGLVAAAFAARHPDRVAALVLVSAIPPSWKADARARFYLRAPRLLFPLFCLASLRMYREIAAAHPGVLRSIGASWTHGVNVLAHMLSPTRVARRVRLLAAVDLRGELHDIQVPTLIVTGEEALDRVVPVRQTREYLRLWPHARAVTIPRTGHLGLITRPFEFARLVTDFLAGVEDGRHPRRHIG